MFWILEGRIISNVKIACEEGMPYQERNRVLGKKLGF